MELAHEAGGDDADDAVVPGAGAEDDDGITLGVEVAGEHFGSFAADEIFVGLAFAVVGVEFLGEVEGEAAAVGVEGFEGVFGHVHAAGGIDARADAEADVHGGGVAIHAGDFLEGFEAGVEGEREAFEAVADEKAVFRDHRDDIGDGGDGDEVEEFLEVEGGFAGFEEGVAEFEGNTGGAEVGEFGAAFRVDEGVAVGACVWEGLVVIDDDDIDALGAKHGDFVDGDGAAIDGDEEVGFGALAHAAFEGGDAEAVPFGTAAGGEVARFEAVGAEDPPHEGD